MRNTETTAKGKGERRRRPSRLKRLLGRAVVVLFFFGLGAAAGMVAVFYYFSLDLPSIGPLLEGYDPPQTTRFVAEDGTVIGEMFIERRTVVPIGGIPKVMVNAVIAAEDAEFRTHEGLDYPGMIRAAFTNVTSGKLAQGASTITQQVARTFFLNREKTFSRKIREILLTKRIEESLTKDEILHLYLNQINFGWARYGVAEAARYYFDKDVSELTLAEAALLAGIPKGPAIYEPIDHPDAARARRSYVLAEMAKLGFINEAQAELAEATPLRVVGRRGADSRLAPEIVSRAVEELRGVVSLEELRHGGYTVRTGVDPKLQALARRALRDGLTQVDARHGRIAPFKARKTYAPPGADAGVRIARVVGHDDEAGRVFLDLDGRRAYLDLEDAARYNPRSLAASKFAAVGAKLAVSVEGASAKEPVRVSPRMGPQGAVVVIEVETGRIAALVGGDDVRPGGFDRASGARRQPGSTFKPFVYLEALRTRRYTPASMLDDSPEVQGDWRPQNSHPDEFAGAVSMRTALAQSLNLPAVKLIGDVQPARVAELARRMGVESELDEGPALALGASSVTPLELTAAFSVLAARGARRRPWVVARLVDPRGVEVPLVGRSHAEVVAPEEAYLLTSMMRSVVDEGTGKLAGSLLRPVAGKTGTSDDQKDAWFVGYTPQIAASVWVGFDHPASIGRKEYGAKAALPIWVEVMKAACENLPATDFERPEGVVSAMIDPVSGLLAYEGMEGAVEELFIEGTAPVETALPPELLSLDGFMLEQAVGEGAGDGGVPAIASDAGAR